MKTIFLLLIAVFLNINLLFPQEQENKKEKQYFDYTVFGLSIPVGNFGKTNPENNLAGFAKNGYFLNISFSHLFNNHIGITGTLRYNINTVNGQPIIDYLTASNPGQEWFLITSNWEMFGLYAGGYFHFPVSRKIFIDSKILFGAIYITSPDFLFIIENVSWAEEKSSPAIAFAYLAGTGFNLKINKRTYWTLNVGFSGANPKFLNYAQDVCQVNCSTGFKIVL